MTYHYIYPGALHLHSLYSDGTGTISEIAAAAQKAGLRWIILTDHNTLAGRAEAGWYGDLLVLVEYEVTPPRNHFLAFDLDTVLDYTLPTRQSVDAIYAAGGWGVIAHPDERTENELTQRYHWEDWSIDGPTIRTTQPVGIELWNWMSDWAESLSPRTKIPTFFLPRTVIRGPTAATLAWWDRLNVAGKRTFGTGNLDSHAFKFHALGREWEVFPYLYLFRTVTNYLWRDTPLDRDFATARRQVLDTLGAGQLWFANRQYGQAHQCDFHATVADQVVRVGETAALQQQPVTFHADLGLRAAWRLICDGEVIATGRQRLHYTTHEAGVYRLEARRWYQPWLFTNPIYIKK